MAIKNITALVKGLVLGISFLVVLVIMFSPVFGEGRNGLEYADDMFNKLSKGSSYFIPKVLKSAGTFAGREVAVSVKLKTSDDAVVAGKILTRAGVQVQDAAGSLKISGDLGKLLAAALADADAAFRNDSAAFTTQYGLDAPAVLTVWWNVLKGMDKAFTIDRKFEESSIVISVMKKAIEPANNFYGIEALKVADKAGIMSGLLVFYVLYTVWWGFAIFFLFEAVGLVMTKAKVKKEI